MDNDLIPSKRGPGRPITTGTAKIRNIRVHDHEWKRWGELADAEGVSISAWIRALARRAARKARGVVETL